jgi:hypothetical protein
MLVAELRRLGWTVKHLHMVGEGMPDLIVAKHQIEKLVEVKMPGASLTPAQEIFHGEWPAHIPIIETVEDVRKFDTLHMSTIML